VKTSPTLRRWGPAILVAGCIAGLFVAERRAPLRRRVEPEARRIACNLAMAAVTAVEVAIFERPIIDKLARDVERRSIGLVQALGLPRWAQTTLAVVLLDYTLYHWHILLHRVPALWRFHLAHHIDLDLDASTALRFHFGEFFASIPWRAAQVALIGATPSALALWRKLTVVEVVFHHANLRLHPGLEATLARLVATPTLHGIHHSMVQAERDSNFSSGLTLWDRLHGTFRSDVQQDAITIGVPPFGEPRQVTLRRTLAVPFAGERRRKVSRS